MTFTSLLVIAFNQITNYIVTTQPCSSVPGLWEEGVEHGNGRSAKKAEVARARNVQS